jgi:23S rRNA (uracil1939-C5)-methyltransferase
MARSRRQPETATISSVTHDGRGIADTSGKKVFVAGALSGEEVRFVRRKSRRNFDEAELLEVITASPERVEAKCSVFGRCGGCALQHVSSAQQRAIKSDTLRDNLERIGRIEPGRWLQPITGPEWNYRRRARLAVKDVSAKGRVLVGFRERHAPFITDMHRCEVLAAPVDDLIDPLSDLVGKLSIRSRIPQIEVAVADNATALVFRVLDAPTADDLDEFRRFGHEHGLRIFLQPGGLDSISLLYPEGEREPLYYTLPEFDVRIEFEPIDFVQVNAEINRTMISRALELLASICFAASATSPCRSPGAVAKCLASRAKQCWYAGRPITRLPMRSRMRNSARLTWPPSTVRKTGCRGRGTGCSWIRPAAGRRTS